MKKYLEIAVGVMAVVGAVANVQAQTTACSANATGGTYTVTGGATTDFVAVTFTGRCSANVFMTYQQNATAMAVGSASRKGGNIFSGSTAGGGVQPTGTKCVAAGCTADNATAASSAAFARASSS
ncbi:MAG: hypothetical protein K2X64_02985 [Rhodocyclaceae bacterium]|nr:hypothetical protein [Rhodocyclaceae bacterium]